MFSVKCKYCSTVKLHILDSFYLNLCSYTTALYYSKWKSKIIMSDYWWAYNKVWISTERKRLSLKEVQPPKPFLDPLELPNSLAPKGMRQIALQSKLENLCCFTQWPIFLNVLSCSDNVMLPDKWQKLI